MLHRGVLLYSFFAVAALSTGAAVWQRLEVTLRDEQLSDTTRKLGAAQTEARTYKDRLADTERRMRLLSVTAAQATQSQSDRDKAAQAEAKLRAELAAARQQLSATETAMQETEDRLAAEISEHAALKIKSQEMAEEAAATTRAASSSEQKSAVENGATGSLPDSAPPPAAAAPVAETVPPAADAAAARPELKKKQVRRVPKPIIRAVKPIGTPFEPLL